MVGREFASPMHCDRPYDQVNDVAESDEGRDVARTFWDYYSARYLFCFICEVDHAEDPDSQHRLHTMPKLPQTFWTRPSMCSTRCLTY